MTRRERCRAAVRWAGADALPGATDRLLFASEPVAGRVGGEGFVLAPRDTLWLSGNELRVEASGAWLDIQIIGGGLT